MNNAFFKQNSSLFTRLPQLQKISSVSIDPNDFDGDDDNTMNEISD